MEKPSLRHDEISFHSSPFTSSLLDFGATHFRLYKVLFVFFCESFLEFMKVKQ